MLPGASSAAQALGWSPGQAPALWVTRVATSHVLHQPRSPLPSHRHRGVKPSGVVGLSLQGARAGSPPWLSIDLPAGLSWCCSSPAAPAGAGDRWVLLLPSPWLVPPSSSCSSAWLSAASWAPSVGVSTEGVQGSGSPKPPCSLPRVRGSAGGWAPSTGRHHETETS